MTANYRRVIASSVIAQFMLMSLAWADGQTQNESVADQSGLASNQVQNQTTGARGRIGNSQAQNYSQGDQTQLATVVVTGSLLKMNIDEQKSLPLTTLNADTLQNLNATTPQAALGLVAQNQYSATSDTSVGSGTAFATYANLRSLGSARTLVLFDGERVANDPYQDAGVNLNTIPLALLDRVEVLADGASSVYGSDAIAGVVNFIPRKEFSGIVADVTGTDPQLKGGGSTSVDAAAGIGSLASDHWNFYLGGTWHKQSALTGDDRPFITAYDPSLDYNRLLTTAWPGNYTQKGTLADSVNPAFPTCDPPNSSPDGGVFGPKSCGFNFVSYPYYDDIPAEVQYSALARGTVEFGDQRLTLQYFRATDNLTDSISPISFNGIPMTPNNPYFPGEGVTPGTQGLNPGEPVTVYFRLLAAGPSVDNVLSVTDRLDAKLEGQELGWSYSLWMLRSISTVDFSFAGGYANVPAIENGLTGAGGAPFLNPFGAQSAAGQAYIEDNLLTGPMQYARSELDMAGAQISKDVANLPAGPVAFALATSGRYDYLSFVSNSVLKEAVGSGLTAQNVAAYRTDVSVTGQVNVPITRGLDLDASERFDRYSDVGDTANPKVSLRYRPLRPLMLRASVGKGFRAPTLFDVDAPTGYPSTSVRNNDPVLCPGGVPDLAAGAEPIRDCNAPFPTKTGGNLNLQSEKSTTYGFGGVVQVARTASIGVDYYNYLLEDSIGSLTQATILNNPEKYGDLIVRCSQVSAAQLSLLTTCRDTTGNPIAYTIGTGVNLGDTRTSGLDITAQWLSAASRMGQFAFSYHGTYVLRYESQLQPQGPFISQAGQYQNGSPVIRYSHFVALTWQIQTWSAQVSNRFESGYNDCNAACGITPAYFNYVGSYSLWNVSIGYAGVPHLTVRFLVTNLFNTDPPFTNKNTGIGGAYDERFTDPIGRAFALSARYTLGGGT